MKGGFDSCLLFFRRMHSAAQSIDCVADTGNLRRYPSEPWLPCLRSTAPGFLVTITVAKFLERREQ